MLLEIFDNTKEEQNVYSIKLDNVGHLQCKISCFILSRSVDAHDAQVGNVVVQPRIISSIFVNIDNLL